MCVNTHLVEEFYNKDLKIKKMSPDHPTIQNDREIGIDPIWVTKGINRNY